MTRTKAWSILFFAVAALVGILLVHPSTNHRTSKPFASASIQQAATSGFSESTNEAPTRGEEEPTVAETSGAMIQQASPGGFAQEQNPTQVDKNIILKLHGTQPLTSEHPHIAAALKVQGRNTDWIMAHPAVVGVGIGLNAKGETALIIMTKVSGVVDIPDSIEGLPVVLWNSGEVTAGNWGSTQQGADAQKGPPGPPPPPPPGAADFGTSIPIGVSTGHPDITAGTIGCRVIKDGKVFALSNNHVYAKENQAAEGDPVLQPGDYDGGAISPDADADGDSDLDANDTMGYLAEFHPIVFSRSANNTMDAAIALSDAAFLGNSTPSYGYGTPRSSIISVGVGQTVQKVGRTTGHTRGSVYMVGATVNVGYGKGKTARFINQIVITSSSGSFSAGGDSGSLIVREQIVDGAVGEDDRKGVGLLFAGSSSSTIANPIDVVLNRFGITIDGN